MRPFDANAIAGSLLPDELACGAVVNPSDGDERSSVLENVGGVFDVARAWVATTPVAATASATARLIFHRMGGPSS
jgi:hypothetical protein